ncbi:1-acyl-sn-glycerol-3-phosphate acyltransferase [Candidatus Rhodobacter oscarellae]|uniref:1-acyl-sn-glycerol-3-phosphate acyltransferase n=1 Tax=Candidatus Rhodobacter oscarellae TaxID=1675527 RepID=A0A0J9E203_9RHOB|nr:lysophospholipid acyltransferase family protein [Candidatus Rhodobacter lobularis]KMW56727.1 1-acyl-sn-glycerol-3-phosphate acyltransferase [Candidatus Rhodobacter lobularis]
MTTWRSADAPVTGSRITPLGWARVALRGGALAVVVFGCLALLLLLRLVERPLHGAARPWTPYITQFVCRTALRILRLRLTVSGEPLRGAGGQVANHSSWLDIFVLNASSRVYFVSKSEVAGWPGIGWLARATGTVFISRDPMQARAQRGVFEDRLRVGHHLLFFPEGTSTDGARVLPFKSTLFAAFFTRDAPQDLAIQPVSVRYAAPAGLDPRYYGWWGDMDFGPHLLKLLASGAPGGVAVRYHAALKAAEFADRKALATAAEAAVRAGFEELDPGD